MQINSKLKLRHIAILSLWIVLMNLCGGALFFMKQIPLSKNGKHSGKYWAIVDDEDYDNLMRWNWSVEHGNIIYAVRARRKNEKNVTSTSIRMHRYLMGLDTEGMKVDHIDHNGLNNQRGNLRLATSLQNSFNRRTFGKSKYLGVSWHKRTEKWMAYINRYKKMIHLGYFLIEEDAARARDKKALELHGEFAHLNLPNES